jgi:hypothetical protein
MHKARSRRSRVVFYSVESATKTKGLTRTHREGSGDCWRIANLGESSCQTPLEGPSDSH